MRKNWLTTAGGIMSLFGGIPIALGTAKISMPGWFYVLCISFAVLGPGIIGIAARGQDEPAPPSPPLPFIPSQGKGGMSQTQNPVRKVIT